MASRYRYCNSIVKGYADVAAGRDDDDLMTHMFSHYPVLSKHQRSRVDVRHWRRCVIRELLKRGLLAKDPGFGPPERR